MIQTPPTAQRHTMPSTGKTPAQSQDDQARARPSRKPLALWKKLLFSALTLVVFFGAIELILTLAGVKTLLYEEDPHVGFSSQIPLFVKDDDGELSTARNKLQFFNQQRFPRKKATDVTRVFCLGGSTTYGRPYDDSTSFCGWLRELLPAADPSRDWELINAGGISYASYRVAALMEELSAYQPDIFIIYCGQNEFLERRTYSGIIDMPESVRGLTALLSRTRIYSSVSRVIRKADNQPSADESGSGQLGGEVDAILDQTVGLQEYQRDEELEEQVLAHYRFNMARIADIARACGAEVLFVTPASNLRSCSPFKSQHREGLTEVQMQEWKTLWKSAREEAGADRFEEALEKLNRAAAIDDQYADLHYLRAQALDALQRYDDAKLAYQRALDEDVCPLRALSPMPSIVREVAQQREVPLVDFVTQVNAASPQGIPGEEMFLDHVHPTINGHRMLALEIIEEMARQDYLELGPDWNQSTIERVASEIMQGIDPKTQGVAMRNLSKVFSWAGKMEDAYRAAKKAQELFPGDAETHYQVGNLAQRLGKNDEAIERLSYLVSVDLPASIGYYLKAHAQLAAILAERGEFTAAEQVTQKLLRLDPANALGKQQQISLLEQHGTQLIQAGNPTGAADKLREVVRLQPENFEAKVQLAVALVRTGDHESSVPVLNSLITSRPDYMPAYSNLSFVLAQLGRLDDAEKVCRKALEIKPGDEAIRNNLQLILKKKSGGK
ncbi:MAG: tetratricopeptide (TPR) repeat protein [Verrucomicrobiales bacterium]|jgi:tetratricopeptide (TPR) repeat protein